MSSFLVMMSVLMLASVSVKFKGILKTGWQRLVTGRESVDQQSRHNGQHKRIRNSKAALPGNKASIINDSSPAVAIIIATNAPKLSILCV